MSKLNEFISAIKTQGVARTNRYLVKLEVPGGNSDTIQLAQLYCDGAALPGMNIATTPSRIFGENREMPYERLFDTITLDFYVDADMKVKKLFDDWIRQIIDPNTRAIQYYKRYTRELTIEVLDIQAVEIEYGEVEIFTKAFGPDEGQEGEEVVERVMSESDRVTYGVRLFEVYPKSIGQIQLSGGSRDLMKLPVTFQYKYWDPVSLPPGGPSIRLPATGGADPLGVTTGEGDPDPSYTIENPDYYE